MCVRRCMYISVNVFGLPPLLTRGDDRNSSKTSPALPGLQSPSPTRTISAVEFRYFRSNCSQVRLAGYFTSGGGTGGITHSRTLVAPKRSVVRPRLHGMQRSCAYCKVITQKWRQSMTRAACCFLYCRHERQYMATHLRLIRTNRTWLASVSETRRKRARGAW